MAKSPNQRFNNLPPINLQSSHIFSNAKISQDSGDTRGEYNVDLEVAMPCVYMQQEIHINEHDCNDCLKIETSESPRQ